MKFTLENYCFCNCKIKSLNISNSLKSVGIGAFKNCSLLTTVYIGDYIYAIEDHTFESTGLTSIVLSDHIFRIGTSAFANCIDLSTVEMSDSVTQIGDFAFKGCIKLSSVVYNGTSHPKEGTNWFDGCTSLQSVRVPLNFENETFSGVSLEQIYAYGNVENLMNWYIDAPSGLMTLSGEQHRNGFSPTELPPWDSIKQYIKEIFIQDTINTIKSYSFAGCPNLQKLTNIESIIKIETFAFSQCDSLEVIKIHKNITSIGDGAFQSCSKLARFEVDPDNKIFSEIDGILYRDGSDRIHCYPAGKTDTIITFNGYIWTNPYSFGGCKNIETIFFNEYMYLEPFTFT